MYSNDHPKNLPNIETIEDILLDIKDTDEYQNGKIEIFLNSDNYQLYKMGFCYNTKRYMKIVLDSVIPENLCKYAHYEESGISEERNITIKTTEYQIIEIPAYLSIRHNRIKYETMLIINDTIQRIRDYLGDNLIKNMIEHTSGALLFNIYHVQTHFKR
jgi:hypothetical protein